MTGDASKPISELAHETLFVPLDHPLGRQINVRGGGGKTTLAKAIAQKKTLSFIELDAIQWLPNWEERDRADFGDKTSQAIQDADGAWVVDGNYSGYIGDLVVKEADMVVWLNLPWRVMFWRVVKRSIVRAWDKRKICGDNTESWRKLFSRDSLWWWYIANRKRLISRGTRFLPLISVGIPVIEITTTRELDRFYEIHNLDR
jgi:adenylate kinase family enzyme